MAHDDNQREVPLVGIRMEPTPSKKGETVTYPINLATNGNLEDFARSEPNNFARMVFEPKGGQPQQIRRVFLYNREETLESRLLGCKLEIWLAGVGRPIEFPITTLANVYMVDMLTGQLTAQSK